MSCCLLSSVAVSGGTPDETGSLYLWSPAKVSDWLTAHHGPIAPSSGYDTIAAAPSQIDTDVMTVRDVL